MKSSIRPSTPADAPAIAALIRGVFAETQSQLTVNPQLMHWKYWQPRADWPGPRSFVLVSGGELIAHGAIHPGSCAWGSDRVRTIQVIDWVARRGEPGAGVAVMKHIAKQAQAMLSLSGTAETRSILPHLGFRSMGCVTSYVRTLHPSRLLLSREIPWWKRWPRFARSVAWTLAAPSPRTSNWEVRRLVGGDINRVNPVLPAPVRGMAVFERGADLFRHTTSCPITPTALYAVERSGVTRGYFLLAHVPGQVRIADSWMNSDEPDDWGAMIFCAVEQAKLDPQAAEVVSWASDPLLAETLRKCGFHARVNSAVRMRIPGAASIPAAPLRVQLLDSDDYFMHQGRNEFWA